MGDGVYNPRHLKDKEGHRSSYWVRLPVGPAGSRNLPGKMSKETPLYSIPDLLHAQSSHTQTCMQPPLAPSPQMLAPHRLALTCVAVVQPDPVPVILAAAPHHVVREIRLCHLVFGVHNHLE